MNNNEVNALLRSVISYAYRNNEITDSEADTLESTFIGDWDED